jgi:hypothetical protein
MDAAQYAGLILDPTIKNDVLRQYVEAIGTDGCAAIFSLGEIDPAFGDQPDLVAYSDTSGQLGPSGPDGFARMVVPGDAAGGRYASNLAALDVFTAAPQPIPEPATRLLLVASLPIVTFFRSRRRDVANPFASCQGRRASQARAVGARPGYYSAYRQIGSEYRTGAFVASSLNNRV